MPLHTATAIRIPRLGRLAAIVAAAAAAGAVTVALTDDAPQVRSIAVSDQPAASRYLDLEANKAASMRALGQQLAAGRVEHTPRYRDIEANKARSQSAR